jgi:hypothetical protein
MSVSSRLNVQHYVLGAGIAVLAPTGPALADCVDTRKPTAAEMELHSRAVAALVAALSPVPVGGKLQNKDSLPTWAATSAWERWVTSALQTLSAPAGSGQAAASEPIKDAVDTANKLCGLFGR